MNGVAWLNSWAELWAVCMRNGLIETSVLFFMAAFLWICIRKKASPQFGYGLFLLVLLKAIIPIPITVPIWMSYFSPGYQVQQVWQRSYIEPAIPFQISDPVPIGQPVNHVKTISPASSPDSFPAIQFNILKPVKPPLPLTVTARLMLGWAGIGLILLIGFSWRQMQAGKLLKGSHPLELGNFHLDWHTLKQIAGVKRAVDLRQNDRLHSPAIGGILHPRLVVPTKLLTILTPNQMRWILLHELAHIRRWDLPISFLQRIIQIVFFFHPVIWITNWIINQLREYACDDAALVSCRASRSDCGEGLLNVVEFAGKQASPLPAALGLFSAGSFIRKRLLRILDADRKVRVKLSLGAVLTLIIAAILVLPMVRAEPSAVAPNSINSLASEPDTGEYIIRGTVVDKDTQEIVRNAIVTLYRLSPQFPFVDFSFSEDSRADQTKTDDKGKFILKKILKGEYKITVQAQGYIPYIPYDSPMILPLGLIPVDKHHPDQTVTIPIEYGNAVKIRVVNSKQHPVEGAKVTARISMMVHEPIPEQITNDQGECTFVGLMKGTGCVNVRHEQYGEAYSDIFLTGFAQNPPLITVTLPPPSSISGRVTTMDGAPAKQVPLKTTAVIFRPIIGLPAMVDFTTLTDDGGYYKFKNLGEGKYYIALNYTNTTEMQWHLPWRCPENSWNWGGSGIII